MPATPSPEVVTPSAPSVQGGVAGLASPLLIGNVAIGNRVVLAPMSGVSDLPFRRLAQRLGAGLVVSEMVASRELAAERRDVMRKATGTEIDPFVIQLVGHDPMWMGEGARIAEGLGAKIIDINMGCPAREVTGRLSGSALMRDLEHAEKIITSVIGAVSVPVTLKMRLGWDTASLNAAALAQRAERAGVRMLTVHGRTRCQFFKGTADWARVRAVVDTVSIPVLVNGDIVDAATAQSALSQSGAAGVMIGRGAYGAPWLPGQIARTLTGAPADAPALAARRAIVTEHLDGMFAHYGAALGLKNARKHVGWYLETSGLAGDELKAWRRDLCTRETTASLMAGVAAFFDSRDIEVAA